VQAELDRIHPELERQLIHRRLQREVGLRAARRAVGVDWRLVGRNLVADQVEVGDAICAAQEHSGKASMPAAGGPVVVVVARAQPDERAVTLGA
jgi:hypothetical protein